jgi:hypothetical protein
MSWCVLGNLLAPDFVGRSNRALKPRHNVHANELGRLLLISRSADTSCEQTFWVIANDSTRANLGTRRPASGGRREGTSWTRRHRRTLRALEGDHTEAKT